MALFFIFVFCFIIFFLILFLFFIWYFMFFMFDSNKYKASSFECGFTSMMNESFSFSMPFFIVCLMFLLFDVEILLICFYPIYNYYSLFLGGVNLIVLFFILFSTIYEWFMGIFSWI